MLFVCKKLGYQMMLTYLFSKLLDMTAFHNKASQSTTKNHLTPNKFIQKVFWRILVELVVLSSILKVYPILTSGNGSFPRWRPGWVSRSYNSHISITIQSRKVVFWDFGFNKEIKSLKLSTANYYWWCCIFPVWIYRIVLCHLRTVNLRLIFLQ